jgi:hypothetical protein
VNPFTTRYPSQILKTPDETRPLLVTQPSTFGKDLNDSTDGRKIYIVSSGFVITANYIFLASVADGLEILDPDISANTPVERSKVVIKSVMNWPERTLDVCALHCNDSKFPLGLCYTPSNQRMVSVEATQAST